MPCTSLGNGGVVGLICVSDVGTYASSVWTCPRPVLVGVCIVGWFCSGRVVCDRSWLVGVCSVHGDGCDCSVIITGDTDTASSVSLRCLRQFTASEQVDIARRIEVHVLLAPLRHNNAVITPHLKIRVHIAWQRSFIVMFD